MLSSFKVIKSNSVIENGNFQINTEYSTNKDNNQTEKKELGEKNAKDFIESYEVLARTMLENTRRESDKILAVAYEEANRLEQQAYEKGSSEGYKAGYDKGISDGNKYLEKQVNDANIKANKLISNAEEVLFKANSEYIKYIEEKQEEIKGLIISSVEHILKKEIQNKEGITNLVIDALELAYKSKTIIVKCNSKYLEDLQDKIANWKNQSIYRGETFVVGDDTIEDGTAIIIRENGKIVVSVNDALEKVREIFALGY